MTNAPARKKYIPPEICRLKYIHPSEAVKLMPGTHRKRRRDTKKPNTTKVRRVQNPKARPRKSRKVGSGSHPPAYAEAPEPSGVGLEGSCSGLAKSKPGSSVKGKGCSKRMKKAQSKGQSGSRGEEGLDRDLSSMWHGNLDVAASKNAEIKSV